jgi:uncharacterized membrane protein
VSEQYGGGRSPDDWSGRPGPYQAPGGYGFGRQIPVPSGARPRQVTIAAVIAFGLSGLCVLLSVAVLLIDDGSEISDQLTGSADAAGAVVFAGLVSAAMYLVPAVFVLQRKNWARVMMIVVAAVGIAGGMLSLPGGILGAAVHGVLLAVMLQQPTRTWFGVRR